jgi:solute carrier family 25 carnitine/acylcarnitine transporter 20/29
MEWLDVVKDLNAGTIGGVAGIVAGHPLDTVKVRLQTSDGKSPGLVRTVRHIVRHEGAGGLYKGLLSPVLSNAPINAVVFGVQGSVARALKDAYGCERLGNLQNFLTGASAGLVQVVFASPSEHVKIQLQVDQHRALEQSAIECGRRLYRQHGLKGIFRGWETCAMRDVPAFGIYFCTYEAMKGWMTGGDPDMETDMRLLLSGGVAGSMSWVFTQPIDVVKSCVQSQSFEAQRSAWELTKTHYAAEGVGYFTKGFGATMLRAFPVSAVTFLVYEKIMQFMS